MTVQFIRPAPYDYILDGLSLYESYDKVSRNLLIPLVNTDSISKNKSYKYPNVVCSSLKRATTTAGSFSKNYIVMNELREIEYTMEQLMSPEEFELLGQNATNIARQRFFEALYANELTEKLQSVENRAKKVMDNLQNFNRDTLAVSHGFFMKYLEITILDKSAAKDYEIFKEYYSGDHIAYGFMEGFKINLTKKGRV